MNTRTTMVQQYAKMQKIGCCTDCVNEDETRNRCAENPLPEKNSIQKRTNGRKKNHQSVY